MKVSFRKGSAILFLNIKIKHYIFHRLGQVCCSNIAEIFLRDEKLNVVKAVVKEIVCFAPFYPNCWAFRVSYMFTQRSFGLKLIITYKNLIF